MVKLLEPGEVDTLNEKLDLEMTAAEEEAATRRFSHTSNPGDLSDGGMVNGVRLSPMSGGRKLETGRAAARRAWMWNGTETVLPLAWNPDGTAHDGARKYLLKRHCLCCHSGGFRGQQCPNCVKNQCTRCGASSDRKKIIPCFYLRKDDVPFPERFYGSIPCFLSSCVRNGDRGFLTEQDMRMHARSRHRMEYQAYTETLAAGRTDEVAELKKRIDALMLAQVQLVTKAETVAQQTPAQNRMAKARAAKKLKSGITEPAMA